MTANSDPIVVISWWSNCLALVCLQHLVEHAHDRQIFVVQVGKSGTQKAYFRQRLPAGVTELFYPETAPAEHARVLKDIALDQCAAVPGVWFVDHDVFFHESLSGWLHAVEKSLRESAVCLCLPVSTNGPSITQPAFWLSPLKWPADIRSFDPIPFHENECSRRPDLSRFSGEMQMPLKDTLVHARDELAITSQVAYFPLAAGGTTIAGLPPLPAYTHLGGLSLFASSRLPTECGPWMAMTAARFAHFFSTCPDDWMAIEDPVLVRRCREFQEVTCESAKPLRL